MMCMVGISCDGVDGNSHFRRRAAAIYDGQGSDDKNIRVCGESCDQ